MVKSRQVPETRSLYPSSRPALGKKSASKSVKVSLLRGEKSRSFTSAAHEDSSRVCPGPLRDPRQL